MVRDTRQNLLAEIQRVQREKNRPIRIAIDGAAGAGKSTLAAYLQRELNAALVSMDDFYLPQGKRTADIAGHMDIDRFARQVAQPLLAGDDFAYEVFDCKLGQVTQTRQVPTAMFTIVEGTYCFHPKLAEAFDVSIFLTCSREAQQTRLFARNPSALDTFLTRWLPAEQRYLDQYRPDLCCHHCLDTTDWSHLP